MNFDDFDGDDTGESFFDLDEDIMGEITMLGNEEMTKNLAPQGDEDCPDPQSQLSAPCTTSPEPEKKAAAALGTSEDDAIEMLSDDEDEKPSVSTSGHVASENEQVTSSANGVGAVTPKKNRYYNQLFDGPRFEMQLVLNEGRPFVSQRTTETPSKPGIGDILVAVNGTTLPMLHNILQITKYLKQLISTGSVENF